MLTDGPAERQSEAARGSRNTGLQGQSIPQHPCLYAHGRVCMQAASLTRGAKHTAAPMSVRPRASVYAGRVTDQRGKAYRSIHVCTPTGECVQEYVAGHGLQLHCGGEGDVMDSKPYYNPRSS
jgi:hypothetical protein